jgi:hypothetical protein
MGKKRLDDAIKIFELNRIKPTSLILFPFWKTSKIEPNRTNKKFINLNTKFTKNLFKPIQLHRYKKIM